MTLVTALPPIVSVAPRTLPPNTALYLASAPTVQRRFGATVVGPSGYAAVQLNGLTVSVDDSYSLVLQYSVDGGLNFATVANAEGVGEISYAISGFKVTQKSFRVYAFAAQSIVLGVNLTFWSAAGNYLGVGAPQ